MKQMLFFSLFLIASTPSFSQELIVERVYENLGGMYTHVIVKSSYEGLIKCSIHDEEGNVLVVSSEEIKPPMTGLIFITGEQSSIAVKAKCWIDR